MGNEGSSGRSNDELVDNLVKGEAVKKKEVELVMRLVDRGNFVPPANRRAAYRDNAWKSETGNPGFLHLSAPCIYASVLSNLKLERGMSFLNIGSGTGYLSTMAGFMLGDTGINHGLELFENVLEFASDCCTKTMNSPEVSAFEWCQPQFFCANAFQIKTKMRYDRIYCGALVPFSRRSYFCNLLKVNGVLIMPYGNTLQRIVRQSDKQFITYDVSSVMFSQFILPDPEIPVTQKEFELLLPSPPRLLDVCRNLIRYNVREATAETVPLEMRYQCQKSKEARSDESGSSISAIDPPRQPLRRVLRRLAPPILAIVFAADNDGDNNGGIPRHEEDELQFFQMLGQRIARHRRARARNIAIQANQGNGQNDVGERDAPPPPAKHIVLGEEQLLDDKDFELIEGFRFKRGHAEEEIEDEMDGIRFGARHRFEDDPQEEEDEEEQPMQDLHADANDVPVFAFLRGVEDHDGVGDRNDGGALDMALDGGLEDGIGHALDEPLADDAPDERFDNAVDEDPMDEALEERILAEDAGVNLESDSSSSGSSSEEDEDDLEREDLEHDEDGAHMADDDSDGDVDEVHHNEEHEADQSEGARLQAESLVAFHAAFTNRLESLPIPIPMQMYLKIGEAVAFAQSPFASSSNEDETQTKPNEDDQDGATQVEDSKPEDAGQNSGKIKISRKE